MRRGSTAAVSRRSSGRTPALGMRIGAAVELREMLVEMGAAVSRCLDHLGESYGLRLEGLDLALDALARVEDECPPLGRIMGGAEALPIAFAGGLVLEQLADLGEREPSLVAQLLDGAEALEIGRVVEAVRAFRSSRRLEQPASPRSSGSTGASGRSRLRLPGSEGAAHQAGRAGLFPGVDDRRSHRP